jgi:dihydrofolate reductase
MEISIIAAMAANRVLGKDGSIPWDLPADRRHFRALTMGHPVIMGRKTFISIGRPLPGRMNIVLSRQPDFRAEGFVKAASLEEALRLCDGYEEVFICGGEGLYREAMGLATNIYLTIVNRDYDGDRFFPAIPPGYVQCGRQDADDGSPCQFLHYRRIP